MHSKDTTLVSVVIPTFNRERTILASIYSVLSQTHDNIEIIVVDDNSTDSTKDIINSIRDTRIRYIRLPENNGASYARNIGVSKSTGQFIAFQDSDDIWLPNKLEVQLRAYKNISKSCDNVAGVFCRYVKLLPGNKSITIPKEKNLLADKTKLNSIILDHNVIGTPTLMISSQYLERGRLFDENLRSLEDWDLAIRLTNNHNMAFCDQVLVVSMTSSDGINQLPSEDAIDIISKKHSNLYSKNKTALSSIYRDAAISLISGQEIRRARTFLNKSLRANPFILARKPILKNLLLYFSPRSYYRIKMLTKKKS